MWWRACARSARTVRRPAPANLPPDQPECERSAGGDRIRHRAPGPSLRPEEHHRLVRSCCPRRPYRRLAASPDRAGQRRPDTRHLLNPRRAGVSIGALPHPADHRAALHQRPAVPGRVERSCTCATTACSRRATSMSRHTSRSSSRRSRRASITATCAGPMDRPPGPQPAGRFLHETPPCCAVFRVPAARRRTTPRRRANAQRL